jgi:Zn-dependent protease
VRAGWDPRQLFLLGLIIFVLPNLLSEGHRWPSTEAIIVMLLSGIIAITVHEFMHAWSAHMLGDDTALSMNRVNLNPMNHFDPLGFFGFVLISLGFTSIAWGKPVPVNFNRLRGDFRQRKIASLIIAGCAPLSNVAMAAAATGLLTVLDSPGTDLGLTGFFLARFAWLNMLLAAFNLIPLPPLDGYRVLSALLPNFWFPTMAKLEQFGLFLPFLIIFIDDRLDLGIYGELIGPGLDGLIRLFVNDAFGAYFYRF